MTTTDSSVAPESTRNVRLPSGPVLVAFAYGVCVLGLVALLALSILWSDDVHGPEGPIQSMIGVAGFGTTALVVAVGLTLAFRRSESATRIGAVVMGVLALLSLVVFWSGAPGVLGACAAWLGGLTKGATPQTGAPRVFAIIGLFIVALDMAINIGGPIVDGLQHL